MSRNAESMKARSLTSIGSSRALRYFSSVTGRGPPGGRGPETPVPRSSADVEDERIGADLAAAHTRHIDADRLLAFRREVVRRRWTSGGEARGAVVERPGIAGDARG